MWPLHRSIGKVFAERYATLLPPFAPSLLPMIPTDFSVLLLAWDDADPGVAVLDGSTLPPTLPLVYQLAAQHPVLALYPHQPTPHAPSKHRLRSTPYPTPPYPPPRPLLMSQAQLPARLMRRRMRRAYTCWGPLRRPAPARLCQPAAPD
jgi:hypothetical protein